jgi:hypothetical protein
VTKRVKGTVIMWYARGRNGLIEDVRGSPVDLDEEAHSEIVPVRTLIVIPM